MNKKEFIKEVATKTGQTQKLTGEVLDVIIETISDVLKSGDEVSLTGFGKFEVRERAGREGRNPITGEKIMISPTKVPAFKASQKLKNKIKK